MIGNTPLKIETHASIYLYGFYSTKHKQGIGPMSANFQKTLIMEFFGSGCQQFP